VNFVSTSWSLILRAAATDSEESRAAFADLCEAYWYPLYAFARRRGSNHEDAADLTQAFFVHLMEKRPLGSVSPMYGRFRTFLLATFKNFRSDLDDRARAKKRGGDRVSIPFDSALLERRYQASVTDDQDPERLFERQWALALLDRAKARLQHEYVMTGRADEFATFSPHLVSAHGDVPYHQLGAQMGSTQATVRVALHRFRRRFGLALRAEIAMTVDAPADIDEELRFLLSTLTGGSDGPGQSDL
jgi:RNA polymerase sigma factor (sigma-70 family)